MNGDATIRHINCTTSGIIIYIYIDVLRGNYRYHIRHYRNIEKEVNIMSDKELLKSIQNDIKNIEKCIEKCIDEDTIDYLETIKQDMLIFKLEILKHITIDKMLKEKQHERIHNHRI